MTQYNDTLPHDPLTERAVLGAIILEPQRAYEAASLPVTAFYDTRNRVIFRAIAETIIKHGTTDLVLIFHHLIETDRIKDAGEFAYLSTLVDSAWRSSNLPHYVGVLRDLEARRDAISGAEQVALAARREGVEQVQAMLQSIGKRLDSGRRTLLSRINMDTIGEPLEPVPWVAHGWFGAGDAVLLAGEWGTGKSVIAVDLALSVAAGIKWMNRIPILKQGPVLFVDEENNPLNARRRLRRMALGRGISMEQLRELPLVYLTSNCLRLDSARGRSQLREEIERLGASLVILDSLVRFGRFNANSQDEVSNFFAESIKPIMVDHGASTMMIDHMRKPGDKDDKNDAAHRISGSQDKSSFADNVWTFHRNREEDAGVLRSSKNRWEDRLQLPVDTKWVTSDDEEEAWIECKDAALSAEIEIRVQLDNAPSGLLAGDLHQRMLVLQFSKSTSVRAIKRLVAAGEVNCRQEGKYKRYWTGILNPVDI